MDVSKLYRLKRGNQSQEVGLIVKGALASFKCWGSQSKPESTDDMVDCTDGILLTEGSWTFDMLPEYVYFEGTADSIEIIGMSFDDLNTTFV